MHKKDLTSKSEDREQDAAAKYKNHKTWTAGYNNYSSEGDDQGSNSLDSVTGCGASSGEDLASYPHPGN